MTIDSATVTPVPVNKAGWRLVYEYVRDANSSRRTETKVALQFLEGCNRILDVGCGTGNFLQLARDRIVGVDYNPECVRICRAKGLTAREGNALDLPFGDDTFDGVYSAHVMHVFTPLEAVQYMKELVRVVKPHGVIAVCTIPDTKRAWIHAENARPYPPLAIRGMFHVANSSTETAPTHRGLPADVFQEAIWFRRPALVDILGHRSHTAAGVGGLLNGIQIRFFLRKYWAFDGFIIKLRNSAKRSKVL